MTSNQYGPSAYDATAQRVEHRFGPNVRPLDDGAHEIDLAAGEFRSAFAAYTAAVADGDPDGMKFAVERIGEVTGDRGASTAQLLDALARCVASMCAGGPDNVRAEITCAAAFTTAALVARATGADGAAR